MRRINKNLKQASIGNVPSHYLLMFYSKETWTKSKKYIGRVTVLTCERSESNVRGNKRYGAVTVQRLRVHDALDL